MLDKIIFFLRTQIKSLLAIKKTKRSWQMPFAASISIGIPLFIGIYFNNINFGLISSIGGMTFLYTPNTSLANRMIVLSCATTGITFCFFLGLISSFSPYILFITITLMTIIVSTICRYFRINPPGPLFFIMSLSIATNMKIDVSLIPEYTGLMFLGAFFATIVSLIYSFFILNLYPNQKEIPLSKNNDIKFVFIDSIIIGVFVGISVIISKLLNLNNFYWVPVSCLVVIQGSSLQDIWYKNIHRMIGTIIGLGLVWIIFSTTKMNLVYIALVIMLLFFAVEMFVVRNYIIAAIFITALTILIAESGYPNNIPPGELIFIRFIDIALGCLIGLIGGYVIYKTNLRIYIFKALKLIGYNFKTKINW